MALNGLAAGLSMSDIRHMKYTHLLHILYEWEDMHPDKDDDGEDTIRDATGEDVRWLMSL